MRRRIGQPQTFDSVGPVLLSYPVLTFLKKIGREKDFHRYALCGVDVGKHPDRSGQLGQCFSLNDLRENEVRTVRTRALGQPFTGMSGAPMPWLTMKAQRVTPSYSDWAEAAGEKFILPKSVFDDRLEKLGFVKGKDPAGVKRAWRGIKFQ
jgi:hypothetical protein